MIIDNVDRMPHSESINVAAEDIVPGDIIGGMVVRSANFDSDGKVVVIYDGGMSIFDKDTRLIVKRQSFGFTLDFTTFSLQKLYSDLVWAESEYADVVASMGLRIGIDLVTRPTLDSTPPGC